MAANILTKKLIDAGITANTDGLLRDFVSRGNYLAAVGTIDASIIKRQLEIDFLVEFRNDLHSQILDDQEV